MTVEDGYPYAWALFNPHSPMDRKATPMWGRRWTRSNAGLIATVRRCHLRGHLDLQINLMKATLQAD
jgi:hypothetical protein